MPTPLEARAPFPLVPTGSPSPLWGVDGVRPLAQNVAASLDRRGEGSEPSAEARRGDRAALVATGEPDPNGPIWQGSAFHKDVWGKAIENGPLPDGPVVVSKKRWIAERDGLDGRNAPLALRIEPGEAIDDIAADLPRFALIALNFPKFSDGRPFSTARLLREKHGFAGELRAVGNVLSDQIPFMRRVGFDSYAVTHAPTRRALAEGRIPEVTLYYQPAAAPAASAGTRPWLRRGTR
jgi:uncharacterized protein (DUF934 family)